MIPVILSGGSGTRLWPLSRKLFPKQFIALTGEQTLFQQTVQRLKKEGIQAPLIVCNQEHRFIVNEQLDAIACKPQTVIMEPFGRNTAPAVAIAAIELLSKGRDDLLLVLPADHVIKDTKAFHEALATAQIAAEDDQMVLFGVEPDSPETGYGYIQTGPELELKKANNAGLKSAARSVRCFVEKPDYETACRYLASGDYYWNSGMFLFKASKYLSELKVHDPDIYETCKLALENGLRSDNVISIDPKSFEFCPENSIDYAVMEKTEGACVVPLSAQWSDVGSWSSLWDVHDKDDQGNVKKGDVLLHDSRNCFVQGNGKLVTLLGLEDTVVVETKDAVMIAHKDKVQDVKKLVNSLNAESRDETQNHRQVYRPWGSYDSVDIGSRFQVKRITVKPGASLSLQQHHHRAEHWIVVTGTAKVTCDDNVFLLSENQSTYIPVGAVHRLANPGRIPLEIIEVQSGGYLGEDDIIRFDDVYGRNNSPQTHKDIAEI